MYIWHLQLNTAKKIFTAEILKDLKIIFETICLELDADLIEFDGTVKKPSRSRSRFA